MAEPKELLADAKVGSESRRYSRSLKRLPEPNREWKAGDAETGRASNNKLRRRQRQLMSTMMWIRANGRANGKLLQGLETTAPKAWMSPGSAARQYGGRSRQGGFTAGGG